jgi:hypothetical protein
MAALLQTPSAVLLLALTAKLLLLALPAALLLPPLAALLLVLSAALPLPSTTLLLALTTAAAVPPSLALLLLLLLLSAARLLHLSTAVVLRSVDVSDRALCSVSGRRVRLLKCRLQVGWQRHHAWMHPANAQQHVTGQLKRCNIRILRGTIATG